jgi:hypothetical protein
LKEEKGGGEERERGIKGISLRSFDRGGGNLPLIFDLYNTKKRKRLHTPDIPLHAVPLRLPRRHQVSNVSKVLHVAMALKLVASVSERLGAGPGIFDPVDASNNGAVEGEDSGSLEEMIEAHCATEARGRIAVVGGIAAASLQQAYPEIHVK